MGPGAPVPGAQLRDGGRGGARGGALRGAERRARRGAGAEVRSGGQPRRGVLKCVVGTISCIEGVLASVTVFKGVLGTFWCTRVFKGVLASVTVFNGDLGTF